MMAYTPNIEYEFPEDMNRIVAYLCAHGEINVSRRMLEELYRKFSDRVYCAQWMSVEDCILPQFAEWLSQVEIESKKLV